MPVKVFISYAHEDEPLSKELEKQLKSLRRQGLIEVWHDRDISAGTEWERETNKHLNDADIILLLVSPDFMDSDYCYSIEMSRAMERHSRGEARVIPIILRYVYWQKAPFGDLQVLPTDAKPVKSSLWYDLDEAFFDVTLGILKVVQELAASPLTSTGFSPVNTALERKLIIAYEIRRSMFGLKRTTLHLYAETPDILPALLVISRQNRLPFNKSDGNILQRVEPTTIERELVVELATTSLPSRTFGKLFLEDDNKYSMLTIYHPSQKRLRLR